MRGKIAQGFSVFCLNIYLFASLISNQWFSAAFDFHFRARVCGTMFRTKLDLKLKKQRKSGSPFFNLRETISMILQNHLSDPKVCLEALLFVNITF